LKQKDEMSMASSGFWLEGIAGDYYIGFDRRRIR
jgi:hypothetical protein